MNNQIVLNVALIDWITLSVSGNAFDNLLTFLRPHMDKPKDSSRKFGEVWYVGQQWDSCFWGERDEAGKRWGVFICEGQEADVYAREIWSLALGSGCNATRLDYQVTIEQPSWYNPYKFRTSLKRALGHDIGLTGWEDDGITVQPFKRKGMRYARIYQKLIKGLDGTNHWLLRCEFEFKEELARTMWKQPLKVAATLKSEIERLIVGNGLSSRVLGQFTPFLGEDTNRVRIARKPSNTWLWLNKTVVPAIDRIRNGHDPIERQQLINLLQEELDKCLQHEQTNT